MHIPHFMYFASDLLVAAYFYLFYTVEMMLDKKQIDANFFIRVQNGS